MPLLSQPHVSPPAAVSGLPVASEAQIAAIKTAFEEHGQSLLNALAAQLRPRMSNAGQAEETARELFSELYLEAMKSAHRFDAGQSARLWLLGIGRNLIKRQIVALGVRSQREALSTDLAHVAAESDADAGIFERVAALKQEVSLESEAGAAEMLSLVDEADQQVLRMAVLHEMNGDAIGQALQIKPAAARQRLSRALGRLKTAYQAHLRAVEGPNA